VIHEIGPPWWYWGGLAAGWIALGAIADLNRPWLAAAATLAFGAAHASAFSYLRGGRRRPGQLSVRKDVAPWYVPAAIIGTLLVLGGLTTAGALIAQADGARHPVTLASVPVAVALVLGGPTLIAALRKRASRPR